jgi:hypothetical protein
MTVRTQRRQKFMMWGWGLGWRVTVRLPFKLKLLMLLSVFTTLLLYRDVLGNAAAHVPLPYPIQTVQRWLAPAPSPTRLAPLFTPQVSYWEADILRWAKTYDLEPNLLATVMQIESCGHPDVNSYAGAQGLFQVMPFHFASDENMLDPDTNAQRGAGYLKSCLGWAEGDIGLTLACYNGGPSVLQVSSRYWDQQVADYYHWGIAIYADALVRKPESETLNLWLDAGGARLCESAASAISVRSRY